jgi:hypothetical protein
MSKSFRGSVIFAGLIAVVLVLSQVAFASGLATQTKEQSANNSETSKGSQTKPSKKRKKKKSAVTNLVVLGTYAPQTSVPQPVTLTSVSASDAPIVPEAPQAVRTGRSDLRTERTPSLHIPPTTDEPTPTITAATGQLLVSEFRLRGFNGANDEFIEIFNNSGADHTVNASGTGSGYGVAASDGVVRCTIPNGTVIPNKGHYLCVNSVGYSLATYPAGNGTTATGDATYTTDIPDNVGIALFTTNVPGEFALATRLDAVGSTAEANTLYKEGTGYPAVAPFQIESSFYRDNCGKAGSITTFSPCPTGGNLKDTNNNAADFIFVDTNATSAGAGQRLGAPGPENLSAPIERNASFSVNLLDPCVAPTSPPNRVRDFTSNSVQNSTFGTLDIRRTITNNTGANVTRLRFRVVDITTFPAPSGIADLRPRTSTDVVVTVDRPPCGSGTSTILVRGTTLEERAPAPTLQQPNGGGFNSTMSAGTVTLVTPLPNGATLDLRFLLGIQDTGSFKFYINVEALP